MWKKWIVQRLKKSARRRYKISNFINNGRRGQDISKLIEEFEENTEKKKYDVISLK